MHSAGYKMRGVRGLAARLRVPKDDPVRRLWAFARPHLRRIIAGCASGIIVSLIMLGTTALINGMLHAMDHGDKLRITLFALSCPFVYMSKGVFYYGQVYLLSNVVERMAERLRNDLFEHMQNLSLGFFEDRKTGSLMATIASDVPVIQFSLVSALMEGITGPVIVIGGIGYMVYMNWRLALATLICLPLMGYFISRAGQRMRRASESIQKSLSSTSALATESLGAIKVVRSFGMEQHEAARFREESHRTYTGDMRVVHLNASLRPIIELLGAVSIAFILWMGGMEVANHRMHREEVLGFLYIANLITVSIQQISRVKQYLDRIHGAATRVFEVLDTVPEIRDAPDAVPLAHVEGRITFDDVRFSYSTGEPVLRGVTFEAQPGDVVALVGRSGAGKSTVANLIPRFYDVSAGRILVDGQDVRGVTAASLRAHIGIVSQEPVLFSGTIRENIAYGRPDAGEEEIIAAARAANAHTFIMQSLPDGYETVVGERGAKLSGGQRQRIAIARALLKDPRILILDEATSALDTESEALVQEALDTLMRGRTTVVIAHRLSTVRKADRILVLADGRVQEQGTHDELIRQGGIYAGLYQLGLGTNGDGPTSLAAPPVAEEAGQWVNGSVRAVG